MDIGRIGIWTAAFDLQPAARAQESAAELDALGYGAIWFPEAMGREAFRALLERIGGARSTALDLLVSPTLVVRRTTAPPVTTGAAR